MILYLKKLYHLNSLSYQTIILLTKLRTINGQNKKFCVLLYSSIRKIVGTK